MALAAGLLGLVLIGPAQASAGPNRISLGTADPRLVRAEPQQRTDLFDDAVRANVEVVRFNAFWFLVAPTRPENPRDPGDPAYDFSDLDAAVRLASARDQKVFLTLQRAPAWAEGPNADKRGFPFDDRGAWKPDVDAFGDYANALARRYSGSFPDPQRPGMTLPRVSHFQAWNEGNIFSFLAPQWARGRLVSPDRFRRLVNRAYAEIKAVDPRNVVIAGGASPGATKRDTRVGPGRFWRKVLCLRRDLSARPCPSPIHFDVFDHHPINKEYSPRFVLEGDVVIANYRELRRIVRAAERQGTVMPSGRRRPMWASELYWETDPPDSKAGHRPLIAARYLEEAIYLLWKQGVRVAINFFLTDPELTEPGVFHNVQGGLYYVDGTPKPSLTAFRFPLVSDHLRRDRLAIVWGRAPRSGRVRIEVRRRRRGWRTVARRRVEASDPFSVRARLRWGDRVRAQLGPTRSLVWRHPRARG